MAGNHMSELSPRQRMINMMYLVLTALLALNISKEVLDAFNTMDRSIGYSYSEKVEANDKQYDILSRKAINNSEKYEVWNNLAIDIQNNSDDLVSVVDSIRFKIEELAEKDTDPESKTFGELKKKDDKEVTIKILVKDPVDQGLGYGEALKLARDKYLNFLLSLDTLGIYSGSDSTHKNMFMDLLKTSYKEEVEDNEKIKSWQHHKFYGHVPVAAMAFMNQMKLDISTIEGLVLDLIQKKTGQSDITVNSQIGVVQAPRQTIMLGDSFNAKVFIAGVDTNQLPKFNIYAYDNQGNRINDSEVVDTLQVVGSEGIYSIKPKRQGTYWLGGDIVVQTEKGPEIYPFKQEYRVDEAMSVISPDKMNVLYTAVDNPVSISVPGYSSDELSLTSNFKNCKISRVKNGTYKIVIPEQRGKSARKELDLIVKTKINNKIVGKALKFRIKNVPDPVPMVGGIAGYGEMSRADLKGTWGVVAKMKDFDFDLRYKVLSYTMSYPGAGGQQDLASNSGQWTTAISKEFNSIKRGQSILIRDIKVQIAGTNSKPRTLPATVTVRIK
tara:strand:- start:10 stop:1671 length:1662 start_codon:yes stop_codon:yes gene_type:complete